MRAAASILAAAVLVLSVSGQNAEELADDLAQTAHVRELGSLERTVAAPAPAPALDRELQNLRIVGGNVVKDDSNFDYIVSLQRYGRHFCGGSLIGPRHVLTAAHCTGGSIQQVVLGQKDLSENRPKGSVVRRVKRVYRHKDYNWKTEENDIAILLLDRNVNEYDPVMIPDDSFYEAPDTVATVAGWGTTKSGGSVSSQLREVDVPVVSYQTCTDRGSYSKNSVFEKSNICAGYKEGKKDSCQGDSGGPLVITGDSSPDDIQVGIVSWGAGCARKKKYGVYTRVSYFRSWIGSIVGERKIRSSSGRSSAGANKKSKFSKEIVGNDTDEDEFFATHDTKNYTAPELIEVGWP